MITKNEIDRIIKSITSICPNMETPTRIEFGEELTIDMCVNSNEHVSEYIVYERIDGTGKDANYKVTEIPTEFYNEM